jgi:hypothetical protein
MEWKELFLEGATFSNCGNRLIYTNFWNSFSFDELLSNAIRKYHHFQELSVENEKRSRLGVIIALY